MWILQTLTLILIIKIMADLQDFRNLLQRNTDAIDEIVADIREIKQRVINSGMSGAEEQELLNLIEGTTIRLESLAAENPSPENPNIEEDI